MTNMKYLFSIGVAFLAVVHGEEDASQLSTIEILLRFYDSTHGFRWTTNTDWLRKEDVCTWKGVFCYTDDETDKRRVGEVMKIDMTNNHLVGSLPSEIYDLPYLSSLTLKNNPDLAMTFDNIENAYYLKHLSISNTNVGTLAGLRRAPSLTQIHLTNAQLSGRFPLALTGITSLTGLYANYNKFTGTLPTELALLTNLKEFFVYQNDLTGQIPTEIGLLTSLKVLALSQNAFTGTIPSEFNLLQELEILALKREKAELKGGGITGSLPALDRLEKITEVYFENQRLTGTIPEDFLRSAPKGEILKVDLSGNELTGSVPDTLAEFSRLNLKLADNFVSAVSSELCDSISGWIGGNVGEMGCDAFLCPPKSYAVEGRQTASEMCQVCESAPYYGSTTCADEHTADTNGLNDRSILTNMYNSMGGKYWTNNEGWLDPSASTCDWFGIECHDGQVTGIVLKNNGLMGSFPKEVFHLPELRGLNLNSNAISFSFKGVSRAKNLEFIDLTHTNLMSLEGIENMIFTNVHRMRLASNDLRGKVPFGIFEMTQLREILLSHNKFTGTIPPAIGQLSDLERLEIYGNALTGTLPTELGRLTKLWQFMLSENQFTGLMPTQMELMTSLETLEIHQTTAEVGLSGPLLPFADLKRLTSLRLDSNNLTGTLPVDFLVNTDHDEDRIEIHLSDNQLTGELPEAWANRFEELTVDLTGNHLTGISDAACDKEDWMDGKVGEFRCEAIMCPVGTFNELGRQNQKDAPCNTCDQPNAYVGSRKCTGVEDASDLSILKELYYATGGNAWKDNSGWITSTAYCDGWVGIECNDGGEIVKIDLSNNQISGKIPSSIFKLSFLKELSIQGNEIKFSFEGIEQATELATLHLSDTGLTSIEGVGKAQTLEVLHLTDNDLDGSMPNELFDLLALRELYINYNRLSGRIPNAISSLTNLEQLYLFNNRISGQIPAAIGSLKKLKVLALTENYLSGTLPQELDLLTDLELLAIQRERGKSGADPIDNSQSQTVGTGIRGPLLSFKDLTKLKELYLGANQLTGTIPFNFLDGVQDKSSDVVVDLISNDLEGTLPASLTQFDRLTIYLAGNKISEIADGICLKDGWMKDQVGQFKCDAVLCPPGTFSKYGRQHDAKSQCDSCPIGGSAPFYGSSECFSEEEVQSFSERTILEEFFEATDGASWKASDNWMNNDESICSWFGVTCISSTEESVVSIHLSQNGLNGTIPSSLFQLPNLTEINFSGNKVVIDYTAITNPIPLRYLNIDNTGATTIKGMAHAMKNLKLLHATDNEFPAFPSAIFHLSALEVLYISNNNFKGAIPTAVQGLINITFFACSACGFDGELPAWLGDLGYLESLDLSSNTFSGPIPSELMQLSTLKHLDLSDQISRGGVGLNGTLPDFANLPKFAELSLTNNHIAGSIPESFLRDVDSSNLIMVDLRKNEITGSIPATLAAITNMNFYVTDNKIDAIPPEICAMNWNEASSSSSNNNNNNDDYDEYCDNILCPAGKFNELGRSTPSESCVPCPNANLTKYFGSTQCGGDLEKDILTGFFTATSGKDWTNKENWLSDSDVCNWYGISCHGDGDKEGYVKSIKLSENGLEGDIPSEIFGLVHMDLFEVKHNQVTLSFDGIQNAAALVTLHLSQTRVKSVDGVSRAPKLESLHLTSNEITGPVPDEIYTMTNLQRLYLNYNKYSGTLSTKIGQMTSLSELYLFSNTLSGTIPTEIANLTSIQVLGLGENKFSGEIPTLLNTLTKLQILSLQRETGFDQAGGSTEGEFADGLVGSLPAFEKLSDLKELYLGDNALEGTIPDNFLDGISDTAQSIKVDLTLNNLEGTIPAELARFEDMRLFVAGNKISGVPSEICSKSDWMNGLMSTGCDAILCPPGTYNDYGRRISDDVPCESCVLNSSTSYYGSVACDTEKADELDERSILFELYRALGGRNWSNRNFWLEDDVSICDWHGIHCASEDNSGGDTVTKVELPFNGLEGTLPPLVFHLPSLKVLNLHSNQVDVLFQDLNRATNLEEMILDSTNLKSLRNIGGGSGLKVLRLKDNFFGGIPLPDEFFDLVNLERLDISNSELGGTLSEKIGQLTSLKQFYSHKNDLSGTLPSQLGMLTALEVLQLSENYLFGNLPEEMNLMTSIKSLFIDSFTRNSAGISGPLIAFDQMPFLKDLYLGSNSLTGTIPFDFLKGIANSDMAVNVGLDSNRLTGTVPADLSRFDQLNINIAGNMIVEIDESLCTIEGWMEGGVGKFGCAAILCPVETYNEDGRQSSAEEPCLPCKGDQSTLFLGSKVCSVQQKSREKEVLELLYQATRGDGWKENTGWLDDTIDICKWHGISCGSDGSVQSILLGSNNLIGAPPQEIFELPNLEFLWLYSNPIDFSFEGIEKATKLSSVLLDSTGLKSIKGIGKAGSLVDFDARFNSLSGPLPEEIRSLRNIQSFSVANNAFTGTVPSFPSNIKIHSIRLGDNQLTGPVPGFENLKSLTSLDLGGNRLTGTIPPTLLQSTNPESKVMIDLSSNLLSGTVPEEFQRFEQLTLLLRDNQLDEIDAALCLRGQWNDGDVETFKCDGILCSKGTYSPSAGRASKEGSECVPCELSRFMGSSTCGSSGSSKKASSLLVFVSVCCIYFLF